MRLRLRIERNELPVVSILWPVEKPKQTIAQFLEQLNERVPLEGDSWSLDDYAVAVAGYEALHYNEIGSVFSNDDEVLVRSLQYVDHRSRTLAGRDQITSDGRHLLDGVPWGKPLLKRARRPEVNIPPPRKRARLEYASATAPEDVNAGAVVRFEGVDEEDDSEDEEDDEDFEPDEMDEDRDQEEDQDQESVKSNDTSADQELESAESSDTSVSSSSVSSDTSPSESDDSESEGSWDGCESSVVKQPTSAQSKSDKPSKPVQTTPPSAGKVNTQQRNHRRRDLKRLKHAQDTGLVPPDTTLTVYRLMGTPAMPYNSKIDQEAEAPQDPNILEAKRQQLLQALDVSGGIEVTTSFTTRKSRKKGASSLYDQADDSPPETEPIVRDTTSMPVATVAGSAERRSKIDMAGLNRLVFGSLGVRTPKTDAEKEALQKKLADRSKRKIPVEKIEAAVETAPAAAAENPEVWRNKIEVAAIECCDEGVVLTAPPFPFKQYWDPQYDRKIKRASSSSFKANKKRKRQKYQETYDKYNTNGDDSLNYDEGEAEEGDLEADTSHWDENALLNADDAADDAEDGAQADGNNSHDGFPALPADITALPNLTESEAKEGDFITFAELTCSAATNWQPKSLDRAARLEKKEDQSGQWTIKLANPNLETREYDGDGRRVYEKFEMEGMSEDGEEEDVRTVAWMGLGVVKLLKRAEGGEADMV